MRQKRAAVCGSMAAGASTALRRRRRAGQLADGGDLGALYCFRQHAESRLTLPVVHLVVMQVATYGNKHERLEVQVRRHICSSPQLDYYSAICHACYTPLAQVAGADSH